MRAARASRLPWNINRGLSCRTLTIRELVRPVPLALPRVIERLHQPHLLVRKRCTPSSDGRLMPSTSRQRKKLCAQHLVQHGSCYPPLVGPYGWTTFDFLLSHVSWMPQAMPFHKHSHTPRTGPLCKQAIVFVTVSHTDLVLQPCSAQHRRAAGFMAKFESVFSYSTHAKKPCHKTIYAFFPRQCRPQVPHWPVAWCGLHYLRPLS